MSRTLKQTKFYILAKELLELTKKFHFKSKCIGITAFTHKEYDKNKNNLKILKTHSNSLLRLIDILDAIINNIETEDAIVNGMITIDSKILVKDVYDDKYIPAHFAGINGQFKVFYGGKTSFTSENETKCFSYAKIVKEAFNDNL